MAIRILIQGKNKKRILRACRSCEVLMFSRSADCPVCDRALAVFSEEQGDLEFSTLDSIVNPLLSLSDDAIRQELKLVPALRRDDLRYANVGVDPLLPHFLERQRRIGVCEFCMVISAGKSHCAYCQRQKRFTLSEADLAMPDHRDMHHPRTEFREKLAELDLPESQLVVLLRIHSYGDSLQKRSDILALKDLIVKHSLRDPGLEKFLSDAGEIVRNCSEQEFSELLLAAELKRAKLNEALLLRAWASHSITSNHWGPFSEETWVADLRSIYSSDYERFRAGIADLEDYRRAEKDQRERNQTEAESKARRERYQAEREQITRNPVVSDWWLNRTDDPTRIAARSGYATRSWKHRWRRPW